MPDKNEKIAVKVLGICRFASFNDLFSSFDCTKVGNEGMRIEEQVERMHKYYSEEEELKYGAVGFCIKVVDSNEF